MNKTQRQIEDNIALVHKPLITVIIPIYNVEKYLLRCLESVRNQTYHNLEVILINDGSTDGSGEIADKYVEKDARFHSYHLNNSGVSKARNHGLKQAKGEYVTFVDSDDFVAKEYVAHLYEAAICNDTKISICEHYLSNDVNICEYSIAKRKNSIAIDVLTDFNYTGKYYHISVWAALFHCSCLEGLLFDESLFIGEDMLFFAEAMKKCERIAYLEEELYVYIKNPESATNGGYSEKKKTEIFAMHKLMMLFEEYPISFVNNINALHCYACLNALKLMKRSNYIDNDWKKYLITEARKYLRYLCQSEYSFSVKVSAILYCMMPNLYAAIHGLLRK